MAKSGKVKNPLAVCWGILLRRTRENRAWTYADIHRMSGISPDFYRNIEKAIFNLHVSQALPLYHTFNTDSLGDTFKLDGIIQVLSLISIMEARANDRSKTSNEEENIDYYSRLGQCAVELSENSKKLKKLFARFFAADLFSINDDASSIVTKIEKTGLVYEMEHFLIDYGTYGEDDEKEQDAPKIEYISTFFDNVPSIYTDFFLETRKNLVTLPVRMIFSELQKWEKNNQSKIKELFVLISSKFDVTQLKNLERYQYGYLFESAFERARFLVIDPKLNAESIKQEFDDNLKVAYENMGTKIPKNWEEGLSKIQFDVLKTLPEDLAEVLTLNKGLKNEEHYEVFWVFKFTDEPLVAFVANAEKDKDFDNNRMYVFHEGRSLFVKEILPRYPRLKKYFPK